MKKKHIRIIIASVLVVAVAATAAPQVKEILKILGVGAVVQRFGGDINKAINDMTGHEDTNAKYTRVVPIITVGLNTRGAIGAAQVTGPRNQVQKVKAVASPDVELFGEIRVRALIPIATTNPLDAKKLKPVDGVGVSGIVDLDL